MGPNRILIVEDEALIRLFVADTLEDAGFRPEEADTAAQAASKLDAENPGFAAAIIDLGLPDKPGDVLADETRARWPDLPIVIASGRDRNELVHRFNGDSRIAVLGKPYTSEMLLSTLRALGVSPEG